MLLPQTPHGHLTAFCVTFCHFPLIISETWPVRKENEVALQQAEKRMVRWMCDIEVKDKSSKLS